MREAGESYEKLLSSYLPSSKCSPVKCSFFSTVTAKELPQTYSIGASYWRQNLESPVLFSTAVQELMKSETVKAPNIIFIEIGPHAALSAPLREIFSHVSSANAPVYLPTLDRKSNNSTAQLFQTAAQSFSLGVNLDLQQVNGVGSILTDLPTCPWDHTERYWKESRISTDRKFRNFPNHELLGSRMTGSTDLEPTWRNLLSLDQVPWLNDHLLQGELVFPGAAYVCMAGEAIQQLQPESDSFSIRHKVFKTPLMLKEFENVEIITNLRPLRLNTLADSTWFEFSITAYDPQSQRWIKHSQGQVRAGSDSTPSPRTITKKARAVPAGQWYEILDRWGLSYRGPFQGLNDISTDPNKPLAVATVKDERQKHESRYLVHPAAIDSCLQLFSVAASTGLSYQFNQIVIPAGIEELYISHGSENMEVEVSSNTKQFRTAFGDAVMMNGNGRVALRMDRVVMAIHEDSGDLRSNGRNLAAEIEWMPWLEMVPFTEHLPPVSRQDEYADSMESLIPISYLYILETAERIRNLQTNVLALSRWKDWILGQERNISNGTQRYCPDATKWASLDSSCRQQLIHSLTNALNQHSAIIAIVKCLNQNFNNSVDYMEGNSSPLDCLTKDGLLQSFYALDRSFSLWGNFLALLGHQLPSMRVLEIGGGTGAATSALLSSLRATDDVCMFSEYTFTDISPDFIAAAQEQFIGNDHMEFKRLDITEDIEQQGFELHSFDLVIASNVIHATNNLGKSLARVHDLLAPDGYFVLHELDTENPIIQTVFGVFSDWWAGIDDGRAERPFVCPERWDSELKAAGFTGIQSIVYDIPPPNQICATMISRPVAQEPIKQNICLMTDGRIPEWANDVKSAFMQYEFQISWTTLEQQLVEPSHPGTIIISLLDIESPFFDGMTEKKFHLLQKFINESDDRLILWVTSSTQISCIDPRYALTNGFFRALRHENQMDVRVFEVDVLNASSSDILVQLCCQIMKARNKGRPSPDFEFALQAGRVYIPRLNWRVPNQVKRSLCHNELPRILQIETYGLLESFKWMSFELDALDDSEVEIKVQYTALNFRVCRLTFPTDCQTKSTPSPQHSPPSLSFSAI